MTSGLRSAIARRPVHLATAIGVVCLAGALVATLAAAHRPVLGTDSWGTHVASRPLVGTVVCQSHETLPAAADALRLAISPAGGIGPRLGVTIAGAGRTVARGSLPRGWRGATATIPIAPRPRVAATAVSVCLTIGSGRRVILHGQHVPRELAIAASTQRGRPMAMRIDYLHASQSWWSSLPSLLRRMSWGRGFAGEGIIYLALALMAIAAVATVGLIVRDLGGEEPRDASRRSYGPRDPRRAVSAVPSSAWICAMIAVLSAIAWSVVTPPFQAPDEPDHFAYVQVLAETGALPAVAPVNVFSPEETVVLRDLRFYTVFHHPEDPSIASAAAQRQLEHDLNAGLGRVGVGGAGTERSQPPLYYAIEAIPYLAGAHLNLLDRLELVRLVSALMAGLTALFAFLFVREALPRERWAWTVGGLGVALAPLLGFISGAVNSNSLLFAVAAALFYCLGRVFRRGLTTGRAVTLGAVTALGAYSNLNFLGLLAGVGRHRRRGAPEAGL